MVSVVGQKMSRYIDADELLKEASKDGAYGYVSAEQIANFPTANVVEVKRGRWIYKDTWSVFECSCCGRTMVRNSYFYCPWCGSRMVDEVDNENTEP